MQSLLAEFHTAVKTIAQSFQQELVSHLGVENGQVFAPLQAQINQTAAILLAQINSVRTLLVQDIAPDRENSTLDSAPRDIRD